MWRFLSFWSVRQRQLIIMDKFCSWTVTPCPRPNVTVCSRITPTLFGLLQTKLLHNLNSPENRSGFASERTLMWFIGNRLASCRSQGSASWLKGGKQTPRAGKYNRVGKKKMSCGQTWTNEDMKYVADEIMSFSFKMLEQHYRVELFSLLVVQRG